MIEILFIACLQAAPSACEERSIVYLSDGHPMQCAMHAQFRLAEWAEAHPEQVVARWSCRYAGADPDKA